MYEDNKGSGTLKALIIFLVLFILACTAVIIIKEKFTVKTVTVVGNEHYSEEEIKKLVMTGSYGNNTIYLFLKYRDRRNDEIPFIERMDVSIESPTAVKIRVYEKALAGYVEYLGHYMYFDKDGIIVESSTRQIEGVPFVTGLDFDHIVLHDKLPVEDDGIFLRILDITRLLNKYDIKTDRIYFDSNKEVTLYFGDARIFIGNEDHIDEKINELRLLLPELDGRSGTLRMDSYTGEGGNFTFEVDEKNIKDEALDDVDETDASDQEQTGQ
mgnify:CR=1 FL=1